MAEQCSAWIWPRGSYHSVRCGKTGKVEHEGKRYCGIHSPEAKQRREDKRKARLAQYIATKEASNKAYERSAVCTAAFESKDGRTIATEQITPSLFWRMYDALHDAREWFGGSTSADEMDEVFAILDSLKVTTDE